MVIDKRISLEIRKITFPTQVYDMGNKYLIVYENTLGIFKQKTNDPEKDHKEIIREIPYYLN